jgi:hypothetical protein
VSFLHIKKKNRTQKAFSNFQTHIQTRNKMVLQPAGSYFSPFCENLESSVEVSCSVSDVVSVRLLLGRLTTLENEANNLLPL